MYTSTQNSNSPNGLAGRFAGDRVIETIVHNVTFTQIVTLCNSVTYICFLAALFAISLNWIMIQALIRSFLTSNSYCQEISQEPNHDHCEQHDPPVSVDVRRVGYDKPGVHTLLVVAWLVAEHNEGGSNRVTLFAAYF